MNYFFPNPTKNCDKEANEYLKSIIYTNKLAIFTNNEKCVYTQKLQDIFNKDFKTQPKIIYIDSFEDKNFKQNLKDCIIYKSRNNIVPKVFISGMYMGHHKEVEERIYRKDLDIFF